MQQTELPGFGHETRTAVISSCTAYRYSLARTWAPDKAPAVFVMLNPSTADATEDDPTIRRCIGFARAWGCGGIRVVNLFAFRATQPHEMKAAADPVGPENEAHLRAAFEGAQLIVAAWGAFPFAATRYPQVQQLAAEAGARLLCLGTTAEGHPRHPLYVPAKQPLQTWRAPAPAAE